MQEHEAEQILTEIENFALKHIREPMVIEFAEGDSYLCLFDTNDWDNNDKDLDDPDYDEWFVLDFEVIQIIKAGINKDPRYDFVVISKNHMPSKVTCNGEVVYEFGSDPD